MATVAETPFAPPRPATSRWQPRRALFIVVTIITLCLVIYPVATVLIHSVVPVKGPASFTLYWYIQAFSQTIMLRAILSTLITVAFTVVISFILGVSMAWLTARTNMPFGSFLDLVPIVPLLIPPLIGALGWVFVLAPQAGFANIILRRLMGATGNSGPLDIYSFPGLIWVMSLYVMPYIYVFVANGLRGVNREVEEAARIAGAGTLRRMRTVTLPIIAPAMSAGLLLAGIMAFEQFSVPVIIGTAARIEVLSTVIYHLLNFSYPPDMETASALGTIFLAIAMAGVYLQRRFVQEGRYATIGGRSSLSSRSDIGWWRYLAFAYVAAYILFAVVLPIVGVLWVSVSPFWTPELSWSQLTLGNFYEVITAETTWRAIGNSLTFALVGATVGILLASIISYITVRTHFRGRGLLEYVAVLPAGVPPTVMGVGFLLAYLNPPLVLYGSPFLLIIAYITLFMPHATRATTASLHQVAEEMEEASLIAGATWLRTFRRITMPLIAPGLWSGWLLQFIMMSREVSASILLITGGTIVTSVALLNFWENSLFPVLAAFAAVVLFVNLLGVLISLRFRRAPIVESS